MTHSGVSPEPAVRLPLRSWLTVSHLVVLALPLLALLGTGALARDLIRQTKDDISHQGALIAIAVERILDPTAPRESLLANASAISEMLQRVKEETLAGVRITDERGVVVATSGEVLGDDISDDIEVQSALSGESGMTLRPRTPGRGASMLGPSRFADVRVFVTRPIRINDEVVAAVVMSRTPREEIQTFVHMGPRLGWGMGLAMLTTLLLALNAARAFSRSLHGVALASRRLAEGETVDEHLLAPATRSRVAEVATVGHAVSAMFTRLQARLSYISEFAGNVAHEFRTPLTTLLGTVELLRDDPQMPADQRARFLDNATGELKRLERLVGGLLKLAKAEESAIREPVLLDSLLAPLASRFPEINVSRGGGRVIADRAQLETAIANVVGNAFRYGGEGVEVQVASWSEGDQCGVDITDNGPGISEANLESVFDRFFTTTRNAGGTGIGLALVKAVCTAHGGDVSVQSAPGRTRFRLVLPSDAESARNHARLQQSQPD